MTLCNSIGSQPAKLPCPWDFSGKNTGVGCHFHIPRGSPLPMDQTHVSNVGRYWQAYCFTAEPLGKLTMYTHTHTLINRFTLYAMGKQSNGVLRKMNHTGRFSPVRLTDTNLIIFNFASFWFVHLGIIK